MKSFKRMNKTDDRGNAIKSLNRVKVWVRMVIIVCGGTNLIARVILPIGAQQYYECQGSHHLIAV